MGKRYQIALEKQWNGNKNAGLSKIGKEKASLLKALYQNQGFKRQRGFPVKSLYCKHTRDILELLHLNREIQKQMQQVSPVFRQDLFECGNEAGKAKRVTKSFKFFGNNALAREEHFGHLSKHQL